MNSLSRCDTHKTAIVIFVSATLLIGAVVVLGATSASFQRLVEPGGSSSNLKPADSQPPAPSGLTATTASDSEIDLAWTPSTGGGILAQGVLMFTDPSCSVGGAEIVVSGSATTYAWTGLAGGTAYSFEVFDANATGNSPVSDCASATTDPGPVPPAPTGLTATTASDSEIDLAWTPSTGGGILAQGVLMFTDPSCSVGGAEIVVSGSATTYAWTGLAAGTTYSFEVFDANATGNSLVSDCASATTYFIDAPTGLTAHGVSTSEIDLTWTNPVGTLTANTVYEYSSDCSTLLNTYVIGVAEAYAATGLSASTTYCFTVSASTSYGEGPQSASASASTFGVIIGGPMQGPVGVTATLPGMVSTPSLALSSPVLEFKTASR